MIRIFGQTDKVFTTNGDIVINPIRARVHKADNGDYYLDIEASLKYIDFFVEGNIIVANTPTGDQAFRINNIDKSKNRIIAKCWHVFYDSENYLIADSYVVDKNCDEALKYLNDALEPQSEFSVYSNIGDINSYRCVRSSFYEAIQEILTRWGGHLVRNNFTIGIQASIGQDRGITVQYKKNLSDITCSEDWGNVITKILPVGKDGILLNAVDQSADIYIESETQYDIPYTKTITFEQDIEREDYPTELAYLTACVEDLTAQATAYLEANALPQVNYTLKANLDRMTDIGDTIKVIDERLGIDMLTHVISFEYDCILEKYREIEFGNFTPSLSDLVSNVSKTATESATTNVMNLIDGQFASEYPVFTEALVRNNIQSGENITTIFGKIKKFFTDLKNVAFSGSYNDLTDKPSIPSAQVNSDWNATSGVEEILNKPTIPTVNDGVLTIQQNGTTIGTFSANQDTDEVINITGGGGGGDGGEFVLWTNPNPTDSFASQTISITTTNVYDGFYYSSGDNVNTGIGRIRSIAFLENGVTTINDLHTQGTNGEVNQYSRTIDVAKTANGYSFTISDCDRRVRNNNGTNSRETKNSYLIPRKIIGFKVGGQGGSDASYSESEHVVGTWIDGSIVYEKTVNIGTLPNATTKTVAHGISGLAWVVSLNGTCLGSNTYLPLPFTDNTAVTNDIRIDANATNISIRTGQNYSAFHGYVTIRYIKSS
jgi:phage minor structural protein